MSARLSSASTSSLDHLMRYLYMAKLIHFESCHEVRQLCSFHEIMQKPRPLSSIKHNTWATVWPIRLDWLIPAAIVSCKPFFATIERYRIDIFKNSTDCIYKLNNSLYQRQISLIAALLDEVNTSKTSPKT